MWILPQTRAQCANTNENTDIRNANVLTLRCHKNNVGLEHQTHCYISKQQSDVPFIVKLQERWGGGGGTWEWSSAEHFTFMDKFDFLRFSMGGTVWPSTSILNTICVHCRTVLLVSWRLKGE